MQPHEHKAEAVSSEGERVDRPERTGIPERSGAPDETPERARREAREQGRQEGEALGRADGLRAAVLAFARARLAPLSSEDAAAIAELRDEGALTELVDSLVQAESVEDARAVFEAAIAGIRK
jgi:flagellar biosynthesis/type III secretory pathway protein FliH